VTVSDEL